MVLDLWGLVCQRKMQIGGGSGDDDGLLQPTKYPAFNAVFNSVSALAMPTVTTEQEHRRTQYVRSPLTHLTALVAIPDPKKEMTESPEALAACKKEWTRLGKKPAWGITLVRDWAEVCATARNEGAYVHAGRVIGFCVEKVHNYPEATHEELTTIEWYSRAIMAHTKTMNAQCFTNWEGTLRACKPVRR